MASIRTVKRKNGVAYQVRWIEKTNGVETSETFDPDKQYEAYMLKRFLDANGNTYSLASEAYRLSHADGPELRDVCQIHIDGLTHVDARTRKEYERDVRLHILPHLGHIRAGQLTHEHVKDWIVALQGEECSPKSIQNYHGLLSAVMASCMNTRPPIITVNPCADQRLPKVDRRARSKGRFLDLDEYDVLLASFPEEWQLCIETLAGTGARWGEFAALTVGDFHPSRGKAPAYLTVDKAVKVDDAGHKYIGEPKNDNAYRDITIDEGLEEMIAAHIEGRDPEAPIFTGPSGTTRVVYENFQQRVWNPAIKQAMAGGLAVRPKIHGLRHSHGSWLAAEGVDLALISKRMGHESIQTTVDIYGHITARQNRAAVDALSRLRRR